MSHRAVAFRRSCCALPVWLAMLAVALPLQADVAPESPGRIERVPRPFSPHSIWVTDLTLERIALVDLDEGRFVGMINSGYGPALALFPKRRAEAYLPATYFSRRFRGERTDLLEVWDLEELSFVEEIELPARRAIDSFALGHAALSDDDRFAVVLNWTPATSLSVVDVVDRRLAGTIPIPGCTLAFAAGPRRFFSLCGDGTALTIDIDDSGNPTHLARTAAFFDPAADPITEKAVRAGNQWLFVSFDGIVHPVDVGGATIDFPERWSLLDDSDRKENWRVGGLQYLAVHEASGRLFALVHQGGPDGHKEPGSEVWVYDIAGRTRVVRYPLRHPGLTIMGEVIDPGKELVWPLGPLAAWAFDSFMPPLVTHIVVTPDDQPLLATVSQFTGSIGVYDANSGELLRRVMPVGWTSETLYAPFTGH
jgi:methylamine dehydrogenase heavy chain